MIQLIHVKGVALARIHRRLVKVYGECAVQTNIYKCSAVVLYGFETWSLTLREERKLRVFENMVLRRIFGPRRDEVTGEWRRLHNEELNDLYC